MSLIYKYGSKEPFDWGLQTKQGILKIINAEENEDYADILYYGRELSLKEVACYGLDYLGTVERL